MGFPLRTYVVPVMQSMLVLLALLLTAPEGLRAECKESRIVEYEDRVEAVCVGEPLTEAQKKANLEEEKRQEADAARKRGAEMARQKEEAMASKLKADAEAAAEHKKQNTPPAAPQPPVNRGRSNPQIIYK